MTDRVPGAPGQYKAVIQSAELEKLNRAESFIITLTRDDHPIIQGTPYCKETVLPEELGTSICPDLEDPTLADALWVLFKNAVQSKEFPGCYSREVDGYTEWLNPPMILGQEYRTVRRYNGKPVYEKVLDLGALPLGTSSEPVERWFDTGVDASHVLHWDATLIIDATPSDPPTAERLPYVHGQTGEVICNLALKDRSAIITTWDTVTAATKVRLWLQYTKEDA